MVNKKYGGTKNMHLKTAVSRVIELMDKQALGTQDEEFYNEAKQIISKELTWLLDDSHELELILPMLTAKQLLKLRELKRQD